jgi:hypothetical protein
VIYNVSQKISLLFDFPLPSFCHGVIVFSDHINKTPLYKLTFGKIEELGDREMEFTNNKIN